MAISEHVESFAGLPVREFGPDTTIDDPAGAAWRLAVAYDDHEEGQTMGGLLDRLLADPAAAHVGALVIGPWEGMFEDQDDSSGIVERLAGAADKLRGLRALFLGDITSEENEISWINQSDVTPLLEAYPALEHLRVRGGNGLAFHPARHEGLKALVIESGGLPSEVVRGVAAADLPNLEHLELWLGDDGYGGDATVDDLAPILSGQAFPKLKSLGLRDSVIADQVAEALAEAPILQRIEALDLSMGTLSDAGAVALLNGGALSRLKTLDIHHHYVSDEVIDGLKATGVTLNAEDRQDEDDEYRYVAVSE